MVLDIADNRFQKYRRHQRLLARSDDPEIFFIADFVKRNSRKRDNRYYAITFRELDSRLKDFDFRLHNPQGNFIDVVKVEEQRPFLGLGKKKIFYTKKTQIGFPGWTKQVGKGAIGSIRRETKLTPEYGVDSATFFRGVDPLYSLLDQYAGPLQRLAFR